ncbi:hypothetical protein FRB99_008143 [Tulasnella sp. 403]|nr:hypothetical protein FRB99_008143 [Tulasnella sp. 403]
MTNTINVDTTQLEVHSACVFRADRAEVQRVIPVELKDGQNEVCIERLPSCMDEDSIRVEGLGNAVIFDVIFSPPPAPNPPENDELIALEKQIAALTSERTVLQEQQVVLADYASSMTAEETDSSSLAEFLVLHKERSQKIHNSLQDVNEKLEAARGAAGALRKTLMVDEEAERRGAKVTVIVLAEEDGKAELSLWYVVRGASWTPLYDLRATISKDPKEPSPMSLQYRASISQRTGEDWNNVSLTLSTASPQLGTDIPTLSTYNIGPPPPPPIRSVSVKRRAGASFRAMANAALESTVESTMPAARQVLMYDYDYDRLRAPGYVPPPPIAHATATAIEGATSSTFVVGGLSTIPSDKPDSQETHKVTISVIDLEAQLEWVALPKVQQSTFLKAFIKNTSEYTLLEGPSNVYLDGNFVCKASLPNVSPQESFSTSLGVDPAVKITYHGQQRRTKPHPPNTALNLITPASSKIDTTTYTQRITIKNTHTRPTSPLTIKDQIPVSVDSEFKVSLVEPRDLGIAKERKELHVGEGAMVRWAFKEGTGGDGNYSSPTSTGFKGKTTDDSGGVEDEGVLEWVCNLDAGKTLELSFSWDVACPMGRRWATLLN